MTAKAIDTVFRGVDRVSAVTAKISNSMSRMGARFSAVTSRMNGAANAILGPLRSMLPMFSAVAVFQFGKNAIEAFEQSQGALANLEAGLKSTNNAIGMTSDEFTKMAASWQKIGIFEDDAIIQNVSSQLLTFGNIGKTNFDRVQGAVMDVTAKLKGLNATGEDLKGTSIMIGKAMDNPVRGMAALRRVGISFSDAEEKQVKSMMAANNTLGAQNFMLKAIERQYGGTSAALAKTDKGMEILARNQMGDTMENIGQQLMPIKKQLLDLALKILPVINNLLPPIAAVITKLIPLAPVILGIVAAMKLWQYATIAFKAVSMTATFFRALSLGFTMVEAAQLAGAKSTKIFTAAQWLLNAAMTANPIGLIIVGVAALIGLTILITKKWKTWGAAITLLFGPIGMLIALFASVFNRWNQIKKAFTTEGIVAGLLAIGQALTDAFVYPIQQLFELLAKIPGLKTIAGKSAGFIQGLREKFLGAEKEETKSPNESDARSTVKNQTTVNVHNAPRGTTAEAFPRQNAEINFLEMGANAF